MADIFCPRTLLVDLWQQPMVYFITLIIYHVASGVPEKQLSTHGNESVI